MISFFFHCTTKLIEKVENDDVFGDFDCHGSGRNLRIDIEDDEDDQKERLIDLLERYGCAWQEN